MAGLRVRVTRLMKEPRGFINVFGATMRRVEDRRWGSRTNASDRRQALVGGHYDEGCSLVRMSHWGHLTQIGDGLGGHNHNRQ